MRKLLFGFVMGVALLGLTLPVSALTLWKPAPPSPQISSQIPPMPATGGPFYLAKHWQAERYMWIKEGMANRTYSVRVPMPTQVTVMDNPADAAKIPSRPNSESSVLYKNVETGEYKWQPAESPLSYPWARVIKSSLQVSSHLSATAPTSRPPVVPGTGNGPVVRPPREPHKLTDRPDTKMKTPKFYPSPIEGGMLLSGEHLYVNLGPNGPSKDPVYIFINGRQLQMERMSSANGNVILRVPIAKIPNDFRGPATGKTPAGGPPLINGYGNPETLEIRWIGNEHPAAKFERLRELLGMTVSYSHPKPIIIKSAELPVAKDNRFADAPFDSIKAGKEYTPSEAATALVPTNPLNRALPIIPDRPGSSHFILPESLVSQPSESLNAIPPKPLIRTPQRLIRKTVKEGYLYKWIPTSQAIPSGWEIAPTKASSNPEPPDLTKVKPSTSK